MRFVKNFTRPDLEKIHRATLEILRETGVDFPSVEVLKIFKDNGFQVDGERVRISEEQLQKALSAAPEAFAVRARNPENDLKVGGPDFILGPSCGNTDIMEADGQRRPGTLADYDRLAKLVQTSPLKMFSGGLCYPREVPGHLAHLYMLFKDVTMTDRVVMCNMAAVQNARDSLDYLGLVFGGRAGVEKGPCSISIINPFTPLKYAADQAEGLVLLARANQPMVITNMMMLGATAPLSVPGALALGNAEILAGLVLAQLARPGVGVVYGGTSCPMDMKSMVATLGTPEAIWLTRGTLALADFYKIPSRSGGSLTDSHLPDAQALMDGTAVFMNALYGGANFILHSFGMLGGYQSLSLEKFILDEEMARLTLATLDAPEVSEATINLPLIKKVGPGGDYLTQAHTLKNCRSLFRPSFLSRGPYEHWAAQGRPDSLAQAAAHVEKRLAAWVKPDIDPQLEKALTDMARSKGAEI
ncbi:MAG: trimethylamine methyltransferase family protein [Candidatus Adiutrix sp.]|jgi:trimethylamine--corrinoid protein Co-methyltransferase|nr:trimethylamine methyltransferase family protein [Candidatus Adiutrix sp.]